MGARLHAVGAVEAEFRAGLAELGFELGRREDGEVEDLRGFEEFLRGGDDFGVFVDRWAELLLQVADPEACVRG